MPVHDSDADAFMRRILSDPADPVPRLVFADWLEESGTSSNTAWACYLRLAEELAALPADDRSRPKRAGRLEHLARSIRATLTLRAETLAAQPDALLRLLPPGNLAVKTNTVVVRRSVLELVPESVARENRLLPLGLLADGGLLLAAADPADRVATERVAFILDRSVVSVGTAGDGFDACLSRNYGQWETESVDSVHYNWLPDDGLRGGPPEWAGTAALAFAGSLILDAITYLVGALEVETDGERMTAWHWFGGLRRRHEYAPAVDVATLAQFVPLLRSHLRNPLPTADGALTGEVEVAYWGRLLTLPVRLADRPTGHYVHVTVPPVHETQPVALNPAA